MSSPSPTGRLEGRDGENLIAFSRTFDRPIWDIWALISENPGLGHWLGVFSGKPSDGWVMFEFTAEADQAPAVRFDITACESPRLLSVQAKDHYGSWNLTVSLDELGPESTRLTLRQVIDDPATLENTGPGWDFYLDRLVAHAHGRDLGDLDFERDYYPAHAEYYASMARVITG